MAALGNNYKAFFIISEGRRIFLSMTTKPEIIMTNRFYYINFFLVKTKIKNYIFKVKNSKWKKKNFARCKLGKELKAGKIQKYNQ